jgi:hypothetical protein
MSFALRRATAAALALASFLTQAQTADLATVTFNVPVRISNYSDTRANVWCELRNAAGQPLAPQRVVQNQNLGVGTASLNVTGGSANTSVAVQVSVPREMAPVARGWRCILAARDTRVDQYKGVITETSIPPRFTPLAELTGNF